MSADPPGTRYSDHGPYVPICQNEEFLCRDEDARECAYIKGDLHWSELYKTEPPGCQCPFCHPVAGG